jgi:hypothetical protein
MHSYIPIGCYIETRVDRVILLREDIAWDPREMAMTLGHEYIHVLESCEASEMFLRTR